MNVREAYDRLVKLGMPQISWWPTVYRPDDEIEDLLTMRAWRWAQRGPKIGVDLYPDGSGHFIVDTAPSGASDQARKSYMSERHGWDGVCMGGLLSALVHALESHNHLHK